MEIELGVLDACQAQHYNLMLAPLVYDAANGDTHRFDFVYAAMGAPARGELAQQAGVEINDEGAVLTNEHMETSRAGLYAIGDVVTDLNQIAVAFGHAAIAASAIHRALPPAPRPSYKADDSPRVAED